MALREARHFIGEADATLAVKGSEIGCVGGAAPRFSTESLAQIARMLAEDILPARVAIPTA